MIELIKNIIGKLFSKEEIKQLEVSLINLDKWYDDEKKRYLDRLNREIKGFTDRISSEIQKTNQNLILLEQAKLRNPNVTVREKQFMQGNREAYLKKTRQFLKQIELPKDVSSINNFLIKFNKDIEEFSKATIRPYHILQEFLANESSKLAENIGNIDRTVRELNKRAQEAHLDLIEQLKDKIKEFHLTVDQSKEHIDELRKKERKKDELANLISNLEKEKKRLEESSEYKSLAKIKEDKQSIAHELDLHEEKLHHSFSMLERALRKYSKIAYEDEKLAVAYLENSVLALRKDNELKILKMLENIEASIQNNTIDLKDAKKNKTIEEIKKLSKDFFNEFLSKYNELKNKMMNFDKKMADISVHRKIDELEKEIEQKTNEKEKIEKDILILKKEIEGVKIEKIKKKIEEDIYEAFDVAVTISY